MTRLRSSPTFVTLLAVTVAAPAAAQVRVVATTPDLGALAREIGGDAVEVTVLAKPTEDPHFVDARPSLIVTLNRADMLIEGGAELELGWLPALLQGVRNTKIAASAPGRIYASTGVTMLEVPTTFDRSRGDVHSLGNPHFMLDPLNVRLIATQMLIKGHPANERDGIVRNNRAKGGNLESVMADLKPLSGSKLKEYATNWDIILGRTAQETEDGTLGIGLGKPERPRFNPRNTTR